MNPTDKMLRRIEPGRSFVHINIQNLEIEQIFFRCSRPSCESFDLRCNQNETFLGLS